MIKNRTLVTRSFFVAAPSPKFEHFFRRRRRSVNVQINISSQNVSLPVLTSSLLIQVVRLTISSTMDDVDSEIEESESVFSDSNSESSRAERNRLMDQMRSMMIRLNELETNSVRQERIIRDQNDTINSLTAEVGALKVTLFAV